jgi:hypothetical protein
MRLPVQLHRDCLATFLDASFSHGLNCSSRSTRGASCTFSSGRCGPANEVLGAVEIFNLLRRGRLTARFSAGWRFDEVIRKQKDVAAQDNVRSEARERRRCDIAQDVIQE